MVPASWEAHQRRQRILFWGVDQVGGADSAAALVHGHGDPQSARAPRHPYRGWATTQSGTPSGETSWQ